MKPSEREQLILDNMRLVYFIYDKLQKNDITIRYKEDLISEGMMGLCKAANKFDPGKGYRFSTFASMCIRNEMLMFLRKTNRQVNAEVSLYDTIGIDADGNKLTYADIIEDESQTVDNYLIESTAKEFTESQKPLDRDILKALQAGHKQKDIGELLGVRQPTVSRHIRAMKKQAKNLIF